MTIVLASGNSKETLVLITVSQKGTTVPLLLSSLACSFWFSALLFFSLTGDFGAKKWPHSLLQSLNSDLLLHQKSISLLSLSQVLTAQSGKNRCENRKVALEIARNYLLLKGLVFHHSDT